MNDNNIFNSYIECDIFCMDIAEAWIKYRQKENKPVSLDDFMDWVEEFTHSLESNFNDVYEAEFDTTEE